MKYLRFVFVLVVLILLESTLGEDYCDPELCPEGATHIACNNTGDFGSNCPDIARLADIDTKTELILQLINTRRNRVASGNLTGFGPAVRMGKVSWDDELANLSAISAERCEFQLDECRNTENFRQVGQLIFQQKSTENINLSQHLIQFIQNAFQKYQFADADKMENFTTSGPDYSPFAVMMNDRVQKVGLATVAFKPNPQNLTVLSVLNFSSRNVVGSYVYQAGPTASECETGTDPQYPALCSADEDIDPNAP